MLSVQPCTRNYGADTAHLLDFQTSRILLPELSIARPCSTLFLAGNHSSSEHQLVEFVLTAKWRSFYAASARHLKTWRHSAWRRSSSGNLARRPSNWRTQ